MSDAFITIFYKQDVFDCISMKSQIGITESIINVLWCDKVSWS